MALTQFGWEVQITLAGSDAKETMRSYETSAAVTTDAEAQTAATTLIGLLNAITDTVVTRYNIVKKFKESGTVTYPAGNVMVQDRALITVNLSDEPGKSGTVNIPGPSVGLFLGATGPARRKVDVADADLLAFLQSFGVAGDFTISDGEYYSGIQDGKRVTAKDNASNG
jgi:hypothetical protein